MDIKNNYNNSNVPRQEVREFPNLPEVVLEININTTTMPTTELVKDKDKYKIISLQLNLNTNKINCTATYDNIKINNN